MGFDIERYLNIRSAGGASFGPKGNQLSFLLDTTGIAQVWSLTEPQSWPAQRTFFSEQVTFVEWSPARSEFAFGVDEGGAERIQLYLADAAGARVDNVTAHPEAKHRWGGWSHDGEQFAFASNRRDRSVFDIYVQARDERATDASLVHEGDGWLSVAGWGPDDSQLLVHEARGSFDHEIHVLDLEAESISQVTDHETTVRYSSPVWTKSGTILCCTDEGTDTQYLGQISPESGAVTPLYEGDDWNVTSVEIHEESGRLVWARNIDGYTELMTGILDDSSLSHCETRTVPGDVAGGFDFEPDGQHFAVSVSGRTRNANVYVFEFSTGDTTRWTDAPTAGIPTEQFIEPELIRYDSFDEVTIPAFLSLPDQSQHRPGTGSGVPVIVDIHGGPESQRRPSFRAVSQYFLDNGFAVFEPNVRGSSGYGREYTHLDDRRNRMDAVRDIRTGYEVLKEHQTIDAERAVVMGGSYGGFMVLAAMTEYPKLWAAGVDIVGIANFVTFLENTGDWRRELREAEYGSLETDREFLESISPITNVDRISAPLFVAHGENDPRVPVSEAEQIAEAAEANGVPVELLVFDDEGHGFSKLDNRIEAYTRIVDFLHTHV